MPTQSLRGVIAMIGASLTLTVRSEAETEALGGRLASVVQAGSIIYLCGELGAGKTTLVRGFLRALGVESTVRSPTYTLIEPYRTHRFAVYHCDLYRLHDPQELEDVGIREHFDGEAICLVEWPERGAGYLPANGDLSIALHRTEAPGKRIVIVSAYSETGAIMLAALSPG
jgi:tRNA threonylcarbamoyladenosine biosynthesis protein TsaE